MSFYSSGKDGALLDRKIFGAGRSVAFGEDVLKDALTSRSLEEVRVGYKGNHSRTEAVLFAIDPARHYEDLKAASIHRDSAAWDYQTTLTWPLPCYYNGPCKSAPPSQSPKATWPNAVVAPNAGPYAIDNTNILGLSQPMFWLQSPPTGSGAIPRPAGAVRAAFVYDHGACSRAEPLNARVYDAMRDGWKRFAEEINLAPVDAVTREWMNATTWLDHGPEAASDITGGLLMDMRINVETAWYMNDILIDAAVSYMFGIDRDGFLQLQEKPLVVDADDINLLGPSGEFTSLVWLITHALVDPTDIASGEVGAVSELFNNEMRSLQTINPVGSGAECFIEQGEVQGCEQSENLLSIGITRGAQALNNEGSLMFSGSNAFSEADIESLMAAAKNRWICQPQGLTNDPAICGGAPICNRPSLCKFQVPAKRVNVYPDEVEVVWFDNKEIHNAAFALWVAAHATKEAKSGISQLCAWHEPPPVFGTVFDDTKFRQRQFVSWSMGYDYVDF